MAVYSKLSLSSGGGIISNDQQADQVKNTATVLIGLGGTGIDALRTIKTQVYSRLKPDDPKAVTPEYAHIRFLGVDTAEMNGTAPGARRTAADATQRDNLEGKNVMMLDRTEFFSIANRDVKAALQKEEALKTRHELDWLRWKDIDATNISMAGAGGIRQVGRFMMMDKSQEFMTRLQTEINAAKRGLINPQVNIHIFSGLSGGTGAGCFLDVCYMVKNVANSVGGITTFGYFFLPDVNLEKIPISDTATRAYIPQNGYAAIQELDYCMNLQYNGGAFVQEYQNHKRIEWNGAPVDMAHLICATDTNANVIPHAYDYAMNVTAEYLMDFLTDSNGQFGLAQQLANFRAKVLAKDTAKSHGFNLSYCVLGAACASIPLREINTYLASHLFTYFGTVRQNIPTQGDVETLAIQALAKDAQGVSGIYESILREIRENAGDDYAPYRDDWKYVRDYGNAELVTSYTNQTAAKLNRVEANAKSMMTAGNKDSLLGRLQTQLALVLRDINRGPIFAQRMLSAARDHNLLNLIDGLIQENTSRWSQEGAQTELRDSDYTNAKEDFESHCKGTFAGLKAPKCFQAYEWYLLCLEQHKLAMDVYSQMNEVLTTLRKQVTDISGGYYAKLSRVMENLIDTFAENRNALASPEVLNGTDGFATPMMTIADLQDTLNAEVNKLNIPNMMDAFVSELLADEDAWITEDENKITRLVTDFFNEKAFGGFADRSITAFLQDKYNTDNAALLAQEVFDDWVFPLTQKARPLFYFNGNWPESNTARLSFLSVPTASAPIVAAANMMQQADPSWPPKASALTDRIYAMSSACALPLCAYNNCQAYEQDCFSSETAGRHYYEGKPVEGMRFDDWRDLSSLTSQSLLTLNTAPERMQKIIQPAQELFDRAIAFDLIDNKSRLCKPDEQAAAQRKDLIERCCTLAETIKTPEDIAGARTLLQQLEGAGKLPVTPTRYAMKNDGHVEKNEDKRRIQKDYFVASPVLQMEIREPLARLEQLQADADRAVRALREAIDRAGVIGSIPKASQNGEEIAPASKETE